MGKNVCATHGVGALVGACDGVQEGALLGKGGMGGTEGSNEGLTDSTYVGGTEELEWRMVGTNVGIYDEKVGNFDGKEVELREGA